MRPWVDATPPGVMLTSSVSEKEPREVMVEVACHCGAVRFSLSRYSARIERAMNAGRRR